MTISMTLAETALVSHTTTAKTRPFRRNRVTTLMVAAAVSLAMIVASALPARADRNNDDVLKALAAIAAIALISKAVKDNKRRHAPAPPPVPVQVPRVPGVCAIEIGSGHGSVTGYGERCLREEGFNYRLPTDCSTSIRIYGRADRFYPEQCLRDSGFRIGAY